jgi:ABC-2 type transport system ATP-binding protein
MAVVDVRDLKKTYNKVVAVDGINFTVERGEIVGLLGPNGAGKTTTIECLEGLREFDSGSISVLGINPVKDGPALRKRIGMQLQESALPNDIKVWEAMDLYASFYENPITWDPLLTRIGLAEKRNSRFSTLSGGQKQRLYIALALLNDPDVVFFDEITTGLDPQSRRVMWDLVNDIRNDGKTVFLTTHFMDEADILCDRVIIIDHGRIVATGTTEELVGQLGLENRVLFTTSSDVTEALFETIPGFKRFDSEAEKITVSGKGDLLIKYVIDRLVDSNIPFRNIRSEHPDLEDVFLKLTGKTIRE